MSNFFPIGTFLAVLFGAGQIISQAAKTAPNLGRFKRWGVAIALYVGFLITLETGPKRPGWGEGFRQ